MVTMSIRLAQETVEGASGSERQILSSAAAAGDSIATVAVVMGDTDGDMPALAECDQVRRLPHSILATYETSKGGFDALDASNSSKLAVGKPEPSDSLADASKTRETTVSLSGTKRPHASAFEGSSEREKSERRTPNKEARIFCSPHRSVLTTVDGVDSSPSRADIGRVNRTPSSGQAELDSRLTLPTNAGFSTPNSHLKVPSNSTSETSTEFSTPQGDGSRIPVPAECPGTPKKVTFTAFISRLGGINGTTTPSRHDNVEDDTNGRTSLHNPEASSTSATESIVPLASPTLATIDNFRIPLTQAPRRPSGNLRRLFRPLDFGSAGVKC